MRSGFCRLWSDEPSDFYWRSEWTILFKDIQSFRVLMMEKIVQHVRSKPPRPVQFASGDYKGQNLRSTSFSSLSNHPGTPCALWDESIVTLEETLEWHGLNGDKWSWNQANRLRSSIQAAHICTRLLLENMLRDDSSDRIPTAVMSLSLR